MKDNNVYEIHFLFEGVSPIPNGIIIVGDEKVDFVVLNDKIIFSDPDMDKELLKKISKDLRAMLTLTTYRIKRN